MCSHPEHHVEVLPDGQIAETHVWTDEQLAEFQDQINKIWERVYYAQFGCVSPQEVVLGGK